jgi:hypothetical protein
VLVLVVAVDVVLVIVVNAMTAAITRARGTARRGLFTWEKGTSATTAGSLRSTTS